MKKNTKKAAIPNLKYKSQPLEEKQLNSAVVFDGKFIKMHLDEVLLPDSSKSKRLYITHPGAAVIIAEVKKSVFLMIEQYRYPIRKSMLEFPAGKRDAGESTLLTAKRELLEETGFVAKKIKKLGVIYPCIGYSNEAIDVFYASELIYEKQNLDAGEILNLFTMTKKEINESIAKGKLTDGKSLSAWMLYLSKVK